MFPNQGSRSYGLQVAALAGVPPRVIRRAKSYMATLEAQQSADSPQGMLALNIAEEPPPNPLLEALDDIDPDELSPRDALDRLYSLKKISRE